MKPTTVYTVSEKKNPEPQVCLQSKWDIFFTTAINLNNEIHCSVNG